MGHYTCTTRVNLLLGNNTQTDSSLKGVVNPPLEACESTDHDDTGPQTAPDTAKAKLRENLSSRLGGFGHLGHNGVGGVRHNGTSDTGDVTRCKGDAKMGALGVSLLGLSENVLVEHVLDILEEVKLGHGVRDLARPQGHEGAEWELGDLSRLPKSSEEAGGEGAWGRGLHLDLYHLQGAQSHVREELSRGGTGEPDGALVLLGVFLSGEVGVKIFEELIQAELETSLSRIAQ